MIIQQVEKPIIFTPLQLTVESRYELALLLNLFGNLTAEDRTGIAKRAGVPTSEIDDNQDTVGRIYSDLNRYAQVYGLNDTHFDITF